jgi:hypothetical protein
VCPQKRLDYQLLWSLLRNSRACLLSQREPGKFADFNVLAHLGDTFINKVTNCLTGVLDKGLEKQADQLRL